MLKFGLIGLLVGIVLVCGAGTMQTHCFGCGTAIHKNGLQMTYHLTVADQISNVVCQKCGMGF